MLQCEGGLWFVKNIIYVLSNIISKKCQMSGQKSRKLSFNYVSSTRKIVSNFPVLFCKWCMKISYILCILNSRTRQENNIYTCTFLYRSKIKMELNCKRLCLRIESTLFDPDIIQLHLKLIELYNIYVEWMVWRWRWWYRSFITTRNKKDDNKMLSDCYIY